MHSVLQNQYLLRWKETGMSSNIAVIGVGSNINAEDNISRMLKILADRVEIVKVSQMIRTKAIGDENQPDYTNGAIKIITELNRDKLIGTLKSIEDELGRDRSVPSFCPRTMDLDLVVWNGQIVDEDYFTRGFLRKSVQEVISS